MTLPLAAQTIWNGSSSTNWSDGANWSPGIPAEGSDVTVANTTTNSTLTLNDGSHALNAITLGDTGTRTAAFTIQTNAANTLTLSGGYTALGNFTSSGTRLRGNIVIAADQAFQIGGEIGAAHVDRGVAINEPAANVLGTLVLNAKLTKTGSGQLTLAANTVSGAGDIVVNEGALKLNAGGSLPFTLSATGSGKVAVNNSAAVFLSKNSGSFNITRPFQFNNTARLETGSGTGNLAAGPYDIASDMEWNGIHTITTNNRQNSATGNVNYRLTGAMSGSGLITKNGPSQLQLAGTSANTISGDFTVTAGTLYLDKTGVLAVPGNILVSGGTLNVFQSDQIGSTSTVTVTGPGTIAASSGRTQTLAALNLAGTGTFPSVSGFNVTGATSITAGSSELNSGQTFTTNSLSITNNSLLRFVGNNAAPTSSVINVGSGGLTLGGGRLLFGSSANSGTQRLNLGGDVASTGTSLLSIANTSGPRIIDLLGGTRSVAVGDGTLDVQTTVENGTLVKSGAGTLILSAAGSTADFSFTGGPVQVTTQATAGNVSLSGGTVLMDVGGATPAKITTAGNFTASGGAIDLSADNGPITPGSLELVRYSGSLIGTPVINIPPQLAASRMNPIVDYGTGTDSAITISSTAVPLNLTWHGAASGGLWDNNTTANFNGGSETFFALDSVTFGDTGANPSVQLDSAVFPTDVIFDHGTTVATYTLSGTGSISGPATLTKNGTGTTIIATDNNHTGGTDILAGTLQLGNGGLTGSLGSGPVLVGAAASLDFSRDGVAVVPNVITGTGAFVASGPGTVALTANSNAFSGTIDVGGGTLQFGDGGAAGSLGTLQNIDVASGATFAIKRSGALTIGNSVSGAGQLAITGGDVTATGFNLHTGGVLVSDGANLRAQSDFTFGDFPLTLDPDAIRLNFGGLKNSGSSLFTNPNRGITITDEAYFAADFAFTLSIGGPITGTGDIFINRDSGIVSFTDTTSDWNGILTLGADKPGSFGTTGGILEINSINNGGQPGPLGIASADPANLVFNGGRLTYTGTSASSDRGFTLQGAGTVDVSFDTLTLSGVATGTGSLTKAGAGTLVLSNGTSDFIGEKIISAGSLVVASPTALGDTGTSVRFTGTTGILDLATDTSIAAYPLTIAAGNSGTILSNVATPGPGINHTFGNFDLSNVVLNVAAGANVGGGDPRVTIPVLNLSAGSAGTLGIAPTTANLTVGSATIGSGNFAKTLALRGTALDSHVTGTISDGLNILTLRKENDGIWTVSGDNSFTGNVAVDDGVLVLAHSNGLGATAKTIFVAGDAGGGRIPELRFTGGISPVVAEVQTSGAGVDGATGVLRNFSGDNTLTITNQLTLRTGVAGSTLYSDAGTFTINTPLVIANAANRFLTLAGPGNGVINGAIANGNTVNLPVTKNGSGTWTLNGAHTYSGTTTVNQGVLSLGQAALDDNAAVVIASGAVLDLDFEGIDQVASLTIGTVGIDPPLPNDVYSAATHPGIITGTGSIRVGPAPSGYATWAAGFPFTAGVNDGENDDPDFDGIPNLLEYVLGGIPVGAGAGDTSILPTRELTATDLEFTFTRSDASESDVTLKVQWSDTLGTWSDFATIGAGDDLPAVDVTEDSPTADLDTVTVAIPRNTTTSGRLFVRLQAIR